MNNVLLVKTHISDGRAWAAWAINPESAEAVEYLVSVNGKREQLKVFAVNGQSTGRFFGDSFDRVAFDLTDITDSRVATKIIKSLGDPFSGRWVTKYVTY